MDKEEKILTAILSIPASVGAFTGLAAYIRYSEMWGDKKLIQSHDFPALLEYALHGLGASYAALIGATLGVGVGSYALAFSLGTLYFLNPKSKFTGMTKP